jgi:transcriptional regulator GlxA family with amidase domain
MSASSAHEIGIVHYPGAQVACISGLTDMFGVASTIALDQRRSGEPRLRVTHWLPRDDRDANLSCVYDSAPRGSPKPRTLIIPPTMVDIPDPHVPAGVVSWVRNRHAAGVTLSSVCSGAFILAETGLVDGKSVATHQMCAEALAKRFPQIIVDVNRRIIAVDERLLRVWSLSIKEVVHSAVDPLLQERKVRPHPHVIIVDDPPRGISIRKNGLEALSQFTNISRNRIALNAEV